MMTPARLGALALVLAAVAWCVPLDGWLLSARADLPEQSPRTMTYDIDARLDPEAHQVHGEGTLTWRNDSPVAVIDICLHMYLNAFRDKFTTFMRESGGTHRGHLFKPEAPASIKLLTFQAEGGRDLVDALEYVRPEDGSPFLSEDTTVARIPLESPIAPGASATFKIKWVSTLPKVFARTGYGGDFHMVAQWYPKPGVFEPMDGGARDDPDAKWGWNCHHFHSNSEFYSNYGVYTVRIRVPAQYAGRVGASGQLRPFEGSDRDDKGRLEANGDVTYQHVVADVHDFAWVAGEDFKVHSFTFEGGDGGAPDELARMAKILDRDPTSLALTPVEVTVLLQPEHWDQRGRHEKAVRAALAYMGLWYGRYPYPTLTVVDPDHRGRDAGGMEYPTLITGGTRYKAAADQLSPEGVLIHEFAHQHFYGLVGSNEFESAWMDEGMTTYATARTLMQAYPPGRRARTRYAGLPWYGESLLSFKGLAGTSRKAMPGPAALFDESLRMPFGRFDAVRGAAEAVFAPEVPEYVARERARSRSGASESAEDTAKRVRKRDKYELPEDISLWPGFEEVPPLAFLRAIPPLSHLHTRPSSVSEGERASAARRNNTDPIAGRKAWEHMSRSSWGNNSYRRSSASLRTLEGHVGESTMLRIMRTYAETYRFAHPKPEDFFKTAGEVAAKDGHGDLTWFFDRFFRSTDEFDFGIESIVNQAAPKPAVDFKGDWYESIVTVRAFGTLAMPMDIRVVFDGKADAQGAAPSRLFRWHLDDRVTSLDEGAAPRALTPVRGKQQRWVKLYFQGEAKVTAAEVDPMVRFALDRDRTNDGLRADPAKGPSWGIVLRALAESQMTTTFYGGM